MLQSTRQRELSRKMQLIKTYLYLDRYNCCKLPAHQIHLNAVCERPHGLRQFFLCVFISAVCLCVCVFATAGCTHTCVCAIDRERAKRRRSRIL